MTATPTNETPEAREEYSLTAAEREVVSEILQAANQQMAGAIAMVRATRGLKGAWTFDHQTMKLVKAG